MEACRYLVGVIMNEREEKEHRRKLLLYNLYLAEQGFPGADEMVCKIGRQMKEPLGARIEVIYPNGEIMIIYGLPNVQKKCRIGWSVLKRILKNGEADRKGRRYRYA